MDYYKRNTWEDQIKRKQFSKKSNNRQYSDDDDRMSLCDITASLHQAP